LIVVRGDVVSRGQVIGYSGNTGDVSSPQLHFEIRHDTQPVNPRPLLMARNS
jgi:murein DD-endopeptidase MepM/ murein hydrolase activator NlpD